jgi:hypothetical protein
MARRINYDLLRERIAWLDFYVDGNIRSKVLEQFAADGATEGSVRHLIESAEAIGMVSGSYGTRGGGDVVCDQAVREALLAGENPPVIEQQPAHEPAEPVSTPASDGSETPHQSVLRQIGRMTDLEKEALGEVIAPLVQKAIESQVGTEKTVARLHELEHEVALLRALNESKEVNMMAYHARRKGEKKAILHCRLEQSYLDFLDEWGAKRGINKRTDALRAILAAEQER